MNSTLPSTRRGFTFIELLVTVAIMITVLGGGLVGYIQFNEKQTVLEAAKRTQSLFRAARSKAQARDTPVGCAVPDSTALYGFQVSAESTAPGSTVELSAWCGSSQGTATAHSPATDSFQLPSGVSVESEFAVVYYTLHGGTNLGSDEEIVVSNGSQTYRFSVTPGGEITDGCWGASPCN